MAIPLLKTKLYIPPVRPGRVSRPRLVGRLDEGLRLGRKLTLLSAPAGFGKTTLLAEWIADGKMADWEIGDLEIAPPSHLPSSILPSSISKSAISKSAIAWLSLDRADNDPVRFLAYLAAAIQTVAPEPGDRALAMTQSPQPPSAEMMLTVLINDLAERPGPDEQNPPVVLVLDDVHEIVADAVHSALIFLLDRLPPQLHLVVATRVDPPWPLARLRTRQEVTELRAGDLRFTPEKAGAFLNGVMSLNLSAESISLLDARTEGWVAGLQMAALSMQGREDAAAFIRAFSGSHRFVLDYLVEEVLDRQPGEIQAFLLKTSILDRLTASLCDALTDREDRQTVLTQLERANLFLVPLDDERRWYRYHHLFADLLRSRLKETQPHQLHDLYLQASAWYEGQGAVEEAVLHALSAGDDEYVADMVARHITDTASYGMDSLIPRWLQALPADVIRARPWLCLEFGWTLAEEGSTTLAEPWLQAAQAALEAHTSSPDLLSVSERARWDIFGANLMAARVALLSVRGDPRPQVIEFRLQALEAVPEAYARLRSDILLQVGRCYLDCGDEEAAERCFVQARPLAEAGGHHALALQAVENRMLIAWRHGRLHNAAALCRDALETIVAPVERSGRRLYGTNQVYTCLGRALLEWNQLPEAEQVLMRGIESAESSGTPPLDGYRTLAMLRCAQGRFDAALTFMDREEQVRRTWNAEPQLVDAARVRVWLWRARVENDLPDAVYPRYLDLAIDWAQGQKLADPGCYSPALHSLVLARVAQRRARDGPDLMPFLGVLDKQLELARQADATGWAIETLILKSLALQTERQSEQALAVLGQAIALAEPEGFVRTFVDEGAPMGELLQEAAAYGIAPPYVARLLDVLDRGRPFTRKAGPATEETAPHPIARPQSLVELLSERELEVLRLLPTSLSLPEIADRLFVSVNTVRSHVKHVYAKLDVHGRADAIERAEELGLL